MLECSLNSECIPRSKVSHATSTRQLLTLSRGQLHDFAACIYRPDRCILLLYLILFGGLFAGLLLRRLLSLFVQYLLPRLRVAFSRHVQYPLLLNGPYSGSITRFQALILSSEHSDQLSGIGNLLPQQCGSKKPWGWRPSST